MASGPVTHSIGYATWEESSASATHEIAPVSAPAFRGVVESAHDIRGPATRRNAHHHVSFADTTPSKVFLASLGIIFRPLDGTSEGVIAPGKHALDRLWAHAKGGRALARIEHAHPARRSGSNVEESPSPKHPLDCGIHETSNLREHRRHSRSDGGILLVHDAQGSEGVELVYVRAGRIHELRRKGGEMPRITAHHAPPFARDARSASAST